ncbi:hypothetical protein HDU84_005257 [Entophlyctis sp. JEL0112]|nr:hypothetical protein HDU84_005257 [Entophlyctis sp. JEL0112]
MDHYALLGVPKDATPAAIKKAYYRVRVSLLQPAQRLTVISPKILTFQLCLTFHPDKLGLLASDDERAKATESFQRLSHAYTVLSDPARRARYDTDGGDEAYVFETPEQGWAQFFKDLWGGLINKVVFIELFSKFSLTIPSGSADEASDVIAAYKNTKGSMDKLLASVPLCTYEDEARFRTIVKSAMDDGSLTEVYDAFFVVDERATARRRKAAEKEEAAFLKSEEKRRKKEEQAKAKEEKMKQKQQAERDGDENEDGPNEGTEGAAVAARAAAPEEATTSTRRATRATKPKIATSDELASLEAQLKAKNQARMGELINKLESSSKTKKSKGSRFDEKDPSEEEFQALQQKLFGSRKSTGKSAKIQETVEDDWVDEEVSENKKVPEASKSRKRPRRS